MSKIFTYNFIRFGSLSQMNQLTYGNDGFHSPPCKKGIYAFPDGIVDKFLLTATNDPRNPSHKSYWLRDENGNKIIDDDFYDYDSKSKIDNNLGINIKYKPLIRKNKIKIKDVFCLFDEKKNNYYICAYKKPRKFKYNGEIWNHLSEHLKPEHIIKEHGSWVLTTMEDYLFALQKEKHKLRKSMIKIFGIGWKECDPFKHYCTDHLEVFIEKIN